MFIWVMSLLSCGSMFGQSSFDVSGTVVDKTTGAQGEFSLKNVKKGTLLTQKLV